MIGLMFAAQEYGGSIEQMPIQAILYLSLCHQREEALCVFVPASLLLLVSVQYILSRSQQRFMNILGATNLFKKISKIIPFRERS